MQFRIVVLIVVLFACSSVAFGTAQSPDILIYKGQEYPIYNEPMELYFAKNPERRPKFCGGRSDLWRGYVAYIEVVDDQLILKDIRIHTVNPADPLCLKYSKLSEVAPDGKPFKLDWYSGSLTAAYGEHIGDLDFYNVWKVWEKYTLFDIQKGVLKNVRHFTNAEYQTYLEKIDRKPN